MDNATHQAWVRANDTLPVPGTLRITPVFRAAISPRAPARVLAIAAVAVASVRTRWRRGGYVVAEAGRS